MAINAGDPAEQSDVWLRVLTADYWKRDGTLHNNAFGGQALAAPKEPQGYTLEFSGRLLSMTENVEAEAKEFCAAIGRTFHGVIFQKVENLRSNGYSEHQNTGCRTDVYYTPKATDNAHADLVAFGLGPTVEHRFLFREWLQEFIQLAAANNCAIIEQLRPSGAE
jgi:hypothetical protein